MFSDGSHWLFNSVYNSQVNRDLYWPILPIIGIVSNTDDSKFNADLQWQSLLISDNMVLIDIVSKVVTSPEQCGGGRILGWENNDVEWELGNAMWWW